MKIIELHTNDGHTVYVNPDHIVCFASADNEDYSRLILSNPELEPLDVLEETYEIVNKCKGDV